MTDKTEPAVPDTAVAETAGEPWEFIGRPPTVAEVRALVEKLPDCYGVKYVDYLDYVQALPQNKTIDKPHSNRPGVVVKERVPVWSLYMSVAGRVKMLNDIAEQQEWVVSFEPEPVTPTGVPGLISMETRIVYREYVTIEGRYWDDSKASTVPIGRKPGTAWVPYSGGSNAAGSNPYEKVETSARGRAIAAWGIGVLPGSGIASLEEMRSVESNERGMDKEQERSKQQAQNRMSRDELIADCLTAGEEFRSAAGVDDAQVVARMEDYLGGKLGIEGVVGEDGIQWDKVKDGQIRLLTTKMRERARELLSTQGF